MTPTAPLGLGPAMEAMRVSYPSDRYLCGVFARWAHPGGDAKPS